MKLFKGLKLISAGFWLGAALMIWLLKEEEVKQVISTQEIASA